MEGKLLAGLRLGIIGLAVLLPLIGLVTGQGYLDVREASAAYLYQDYPPPETTQPPPPPTPTDPFYPAPETPTPVFIDIDDTPTPMPTFTEEATRSNVFLTEDALMNDARVTPGSSQTIEVTTTSTPTRTPTPSQTVPQATATVTVQPAREKNEVPLDQVLIVGGGFVLPFLLLAFGYLMIAFIRAGK